MVLSEEDKILIKILYMCKGYSARQLISDFPEKGWKLRSLNCLSRIQQAIIDQVIDQWRVALCIPEREADILIICCNVLALYCLSALFAVNTMFHLNVHDDNILRYEDGAGNTVEENSSVFSLIRIR